MARTREAEQLLRQGLHPSAIAQRMGISTKSVIQYLRTRVGEGSLRLSDLYFSWPPEKRGVLQQAADSKGFPDYGLLSPHGLDRDDLILFQSLRRSNVFYGDMYEFVSGVEKSIHQLVRARLEHEFGTDESGWWRKGVPKNIRVRCAERYEEDDEPAPEPYAYTSFIDLGKIIADNWNLFTSHLPERYRVNRKRLEADLTRLNRIRNSVMHPIKGKKWSEDDFEFVRLLVSQFSTEFTIAVVDVT